MLPFLPLFAQNAASSMDVSASRGISFAFVGVCTILIVGAFVLLMLRLVMKNGLREREMEHLERLRALETGTPLPGDGPWWTPNRVAAGIGVGVPVFAFVTAFLATNMTREPQIIAVWASTGAVAVAAIICGSVLAFHLPKPAEPQPRAMTGTGSKAAFDPDAYDTAGRRG
jgi:hypothetical protein